MYQSNGFRKSFPPQNHQRIVDHYLLKQLAGECVGEFTFENNLVNILCYMKYARDPVQVSGNLNCTVGGAISVTFRTFGAHFGNHLENFKFSGFRIFTKSVENVETKDGVPGRPAWPPRGCVIPPEKSSTGIWPSINGT